MTYLLNLIYIYVVYVYKLRKVNECKIISLLYIEQLNKSINIRFR